MKGRKCYTKWENDQKNSCQLMEFHLKISAFKIGKGLSVDKMLDNKQNFLFLLFGFWMVI